jgi:hypothetical protein
MGWAYCGEDSEGRQIGYGVEAKCDHPDCDVIIDRGMSYACGDTHGDGDGTVDYMYCEKYFCSAHMQMGHEVQQCMACYKEEEAHASSGPESVE